MSVSPGAVDESKGILGLCRVPRALRRGKNRVGALGLQPALASDATGPDPVNWLVLPTSQLRPESRADSTVLEPQPIRK